MCRFAVGDSLAWDMIEIILDEFWDEINDTLYFLPGSQRLILAKSEEMDDGLGEDDLTYLKVNLLIFEYLDLLDPSTNTHILKDVDSDVDDSWFTRLVRHLQTINITLKFIDRPHTHQTSLSYTFTPWTTSIYLNYARHSGHFEFSFAHY